MSLTLKDYNLAKGDKVLVLYRGRRAGENRDPVVVEEVNDEGQQRYVRAESILDKGDVSLGGGTKVLGKLLL